MKRILALLLSFGLLAGCGTIQNPYDNYTGSQIRSIPSSQLCYTMQHKRYQFSQNVLNELNRRGYKDCSESEIYCRENLDLKPGSQAYVNCRLSRDQYDLNVQNANMQAYLGMQQMQNERQYLMQQNQPQQVYVYHSGLY